MKVETTKEDELRKFFPFTRLVEVKFIFLDEEELEE